MVSFLRILYFSMVLEFVWYSVLLILAFLPSFFSNGIWISINVIVALVSVNFGLNVLLSVCTFAKSAMVGYKGKNPFLIRAYHNLDEHRIRMLCLSVLLFTGWVHLRVETGYNLTPPMLKYTLYPKQYIEALSLSGLGMAQCLGFYVSTIEVISKHRDLKMVRIYM